MNEETDYPVGFDRPRTAYQSAMDMLKEGKRLGEQKVAERFAKLREGQKPQPGKRKRKKLVKDRLKPSQVKKQINEKWLPVVRYEGYYAVSNLGRVARILKGGDYRMLKPGLAPSGCNVVKLSVKANKRSNVMAVSTIVAMAFLRMGVNQRVIRLDENMLNDRVDNLQVVVSKSSVVGDLEACDEK